MTMNTFVLRLTSILRRCSSLLWLVALIASVSPANAAHLNGVAFKTVTAADPVHRGALSAVVFYPSTVPTQPTRVGPYLVQATPGAPAQPHRHPLVVFSHGSGGSRWAHHTLASYLAARGFVVAALEHPGDNFRDDTGRGTPEVWYGRPAQIRSLLDRLTTEPSWKSVINPQRIGFFGFSAGGYTGLMLAGAAPDFRRVQQYCRSHPGDASFCPFPSLPVAPKGLVTTDPRIKAMTLAAPVGVVFSPSSLQAIQQPTLLMWADRDEVLIPEFNAEAVARALPRLAGKEMIHGAGHYVFMSPCTDDLAAIAPEICTDKTGIHRNAIHARLNAVISKFFSDTL